LIISISILKELDSLFFESGFFAFQFFLSLTYKHYTVMDSIPRGIFLQIANFYEQDAIEGLLLFFNIWIGACDFYF